MGMDRTDKLVIQANGLHFQKLNEAIRGAESTAIDIRGCNGQRYIASGLGGRDITISGTPGNALGAYLDGCKITVFGNAQDATGDTMNEGEIRIHGSAGDAAGYAMRGGKILVEGSTGYRAGIHMKEYKEKVPVLIVGGTAGSFLGEYQAGGRIVVLGLDTEGGPVVGRFCGTGMHGGKIFLRCNDLPADLPAQVMAAEARPEDRAELRELLTDFCREFERDMEDVLNHRFYVLTPNTSNPYKQLYTYN